MDYQKIAKEIQEVFQKHDADYPDMMSILLTSCLCIANACGVSKEKTKDLMLEYIDLKEHDIWD